MLPSLPSNELLFKNAPVLNKAAIAPAREPVRFSSPPATIETPADYQLKMSRPIARTQAPMAQNPLPNLDLPRDASLAGLGLEENQWAAPSLKQW